MNAFMKFVSKVSQSIYPSLYTVPVLVVFQLTIFSFLKSKHVSTVESVIKILWALVHLFAYITGYIGSFFPKVWLSPWLRG